MAQCILRGLYTCWCDSVTEDELNTWNLSTNDAWTELKETPPKREEKDKESERDSEVKRRPTRPVQQQQQTSETQDMNTNADNVTLPNPSPTVDQKHFRVDDRFIVALHTVRAPLSDSYPTFDREIETLLNMVITGTGMSVVFDPNLARYANNHILYVMCPTTGRISENQDRDFPGVMGELKLKNAASDCVLIILIFGDADQVPTSILNTENFQFFVNTKGLVESNKNTKTAKLLARRLGVNVAI